MADVEDCGEVADVAALAGSAGAATMLAGGSGRRKGKSGRKASKKKKEKKAQSSSGKKRPRPHLDGTGGEPGGMGASKDKPAGALAAAGAGAEAEEAETPLPARFGWCRRDPDLNGKQARKFIASRKTLPIWTFKKQIVESVCKYRATVVVGDTGSGKTTQLPQFLFDAGLSRPVVIQGDQPSNGDAEGQVEQAAGDAEGQVEHAAGDAEGQVEHAAGDAEGQVEHAAGDAEGQVEHAAGDASKPGGAGPRRLGGRIAITQPRRVAAITVARRVAQELGTTVGGRAGRVGYRVRFDDRTGPKTRLKFVTDGILLREAMLDPALSQYSVVVLDEAHERTTNTDLLIGVLRLAMNRRPELRVVVMSATLDLRLFADFFKANAITVPGRQHPVTVLYAGKSPHSAVEAAADAVLQAHATESQREAEEGREAGGVLVFLPGQEEIEQCAALVAHKARRDAAADGKSQRRGGGSAAEELHLVQLYASMPADRQMEAFEPAPGGRRMVVLATNIAETSVTIPGLSVVVDTGLAKVRRFQPGSGAETLRAERISRAQARQRAGRAGRERPGSCYRLFPETSWREMRAAPEPEMTRVSLTAVMLQLLAMGHTVADIPTFPFLEPPSPRALQDAAEELIALQAVDTASGELTDTGRKMAALPLDPRQSGLLLTSARLGCSDEGVSLVAILSSDGFFFRPRGDGEAAALQALRAFVAWEGDLFTSLAALQRFTAASEAAAAAQALTQSTEAAIGVVDAGTAAVVAEAVAAALGQGPAHSERVVDIRDMANEEDQGGGDQLDGSTRRQRKKRQKQQAVPAALRLAGASLRQVRQWCSQHFLSMRALRHATAVRQQLLEVCGQIGVPVVPAAEGAQWPSNEEWRARHSASKDGPATSPVGDLLRRCLLLAFPDNAARLQPLDVEESQRERDDVGGRGGVRRGKKGKKKGRQQASGPPAAAREYRVLATGRSVRVHPASVLAQRRPAPEVVLFTELVETTKAYVRGVTRVEAGWLQALAGGEEAATRPSAKRRRPE